MYLPHGQHRINMEESTRRMCTCIYREDVKAELIDQMYIGLPVQVRTLSLTLRGTKTGPESVEGLAAQAEALQYLAGVVLACAPHLKVRTAPHLHDMNSVVIMDKLHVPC